MDKIITKEPIPLPKYRLRWVFEFQGKATKKGVWNGVSKHKEDSAWAVNKDGLLRAYIEGEQYHTYKTRIFYECSGQDYASCQWEAFSRVSNALTLTTTQKPRTNISGLSFLTRDEKITVYVNGTIQKRPLTKEEMAFKIHEYTGGK